MRQLLPRLAQTTAHEVQVRLSDRAWRAVEAAAFACGRERWRRDRLHRRLVSRSAELAAARNALVQRAWSGAHAALRAHFLRRTPRFLIAPDGWKALSENVRSRFPSAPGDAIHRATSLLDGRYDLLGYADLSFRGEDGTVDWHRDPVHGRRAPLRFWTRVPYLDPAVGDHKVIWELNRHQHWLALGRAAWLTGDPRYAAAFTAEFDSWMAANAPLAGINWASMLELGFRSISWIWALHLFTPLTPDEDQPWLVDLLVGLDRQLDHIARHLSFYFSPNTHLLGEALSLYLAGRVLPELASAPRWEEIGRRILVHQTHAQVHRDGGHAELSTHYHRYALDFYLLALAVARRTGDPVEERFAEVVSRMASFCRALAGDDGLLPTIGDDDGGRLFPMCARSPADASDSLALAAALLGRPELAVGEPPEEVLWMLGGEGAALARPADGFEPVSRMFTDSGYAVLRAPHAHAILDAGPHGFLNGGHAHSDALSLVLSVHGRPLLVDPGTATYTMDPELRDRFRSTAMHNTVVVDGRPQSMPAGPFHWQTRTHAQVDLWLASTGARGSHGPVPAGDARPPVAFDYVEASHDGYLPLVHRRGVLVLKEAVWLIVDHVLGAGHHRADAYWHVDPAWSLVSASARAVCLAHRDGLQAALAFTAPDRRELRGDEDGLGWCAPIYGHLVPSLTLRVSEEAPAPFSLVTAIAVSESSVRLSVDLLSVVAEADDGWHRTAVRVEVDDQILVAVFATPQAALSTSEGREPREHHDRGDRETRAAGSRDPRRSLCHVTLPDGHLSTDARLTVLRCSRSGEPVALDLLDGAMAAWTGRASFTLGPLASAGDLHLDLAALRRLSRGAHTRSAG